ncbi:type II toxin-antitoxin system mRNA interferase toxin, RelE/StbE family [Candidatus Woesebacteria bacterium CG07_land_8_20_14_0_80_44_9]|uniref:Type II toxin-antitoxin system mRNA interferase toxin, RelE/StbE family n=1 Tax=Candidatus Woesebacteria bacterium CG07_land_8_20_14_0_80_44_9 TaxID=1975058 RepID=A0A2M6YF23_9BACT|nr:MAG: type II toxin-antitoxin system mRNA interferase toxin, RelE/StbE family [Candidatus Woesebacteria bacterium CG07_land_8_20_14_0_80_44_9]
MKIYYSSKFASKYRKLPQQVKILMREKQDIFFKNPFDPKLKTHKLAGKLKGFWSFSIDKKYRIRFEFLGKQTIRLHSVGTHNIYRK